MGREEGAIEKGIVERLKEILTMFAYRREIRTEGTEGLRTGLGAEDPGDFLFDLDHAPSAFGQIVSKGDGEVSHEG